MISEMRSHLDTHDSVCARILFILLTRPPDPSRKNLFAREMRTVTPATRTTQRKPPNCANYRRASKAYVYVCVYIRQANMSDTLPRQQRRERRRESGAAAEQKMCYRNICVVYNNFSTGLFI